MGAADGLRARLRQAEVTDLALGYQLAHCPGDVLDGDVGVDAVLVEQVDPVGLQPLERRVGHVPDVFRPAVEAAALAGAGVDVETELGRYHDLIAYRGEGLADEFLVGERPVGFGGVEEGDTLVGRGADQGDTGLLVCWLAIVDAQAHAAQPQSRDLQAAAEGAGLHCAHLRKSLFP